jgi:hypothetical protein
VAGDPSVTVGMPVGRRATTGVSHPTAYEETRHAVQWPCGTKASVASADVGREPYSTWDGSHDLVPSFPQIRRATASPFFYRCLRTSRTVTRLIGSAAWQTSRSGPIQLHPCDDDEPTPVRSQTAEVLACLIVITGAAAIGRRPAACVALGPRRPQVGSRRGPSPPAPFRATRRACRPIP